MTSLAITRHAALDVLLLAVILTSHDAWLIALAVAVLALDTVAFAHGTGSRGGL